MNRITACPHCSTRLSVPEGITDKTLICPHCLADVDNPQQGFQIQAANINTDVKRYMSVSGIVLAALIGFCVFGIAIAFFVPRGRHWAETPRIFLLLFSFAALDVLVSIAIIRGLVRWGISGVRTPSVGRVIGIVFLSLGSIVAVIIFFFFTCFFAVAVGGY
jgi:hypothetical protein